MAGILRLFKKYQLISFRKGWIIWLRDRFEINSLDKTSEKIGIAIPVVEEDYISSDVLE